MTFRRLPDDLDPRRPGGAGKEDDSGEVEERRKRARSYSQYIDDSRDDLEEFEEVTDEVAREGGEEAEDSDSLSKSRTRHRKIQEREEFEDLTGEVTREDDENA